MEDSRTESSAVMQSFAGSILDRHRRMIPDSAGAGVAHGFVRAQVGRAAPDRPRRPMAADREAAAVVTGRGVERSCPSRPSESQCRRERPCCASARSSAANARGVRRRAGRAGRAGETPKSARRRSCNPIARSESPARHRAASHIFGGTGPDSGDEHPRTGDDANQWQRNRDARLPDARAHAYPRAQLRGAGQRRATGRSSRHAVFRNRSTCRSACADHPGRRAAVGDRARRHESGAAATVAADVHQGRVAAIDVARPVERPSTTCRPAIADACGVGA